MRIAICDDGKFYRDKVKENLETYKEDYPEIEILEFTCGENLIASIECFKEPGQKLRVGKIQDNSSSFAFPILYPFIFWYI